MTFLFVGVLFTHYYYYYYDVNEDDIGGTSIFFPFILKLFQ